MKTLRQPLEILTEALSNFAGTPERRLMAVLVDAKLRGPALDLIMRTDSHADNRSAFFRFDEPFAEETAGWDARTARLRADFTARVAKTAAEGGVANAELAPIVGAEDEIAVFGQHLLALQEACRDIAVGKGITVVVAPTEVADPSEAAIGIEGLAASPSLASIRWIVATDSDALADRLAGNVAVGASLVRCQVDESALRAETGGLIARGASGSPRAGGGVWPNTQVPTRRRARKKSGRGPAVIPPEIDGLVRATKVHQDAAGYVKGAAASIAGGDPLEAVRLQTLARDAYVTAGLVAEGVRMELILGTLQTQVDTNVGGGVSAALRTFMRALSRAEAAGLAREASLAALGQAQLHLMAASPSDAFSMFSRAASHAAVAGMPVLAFEAYRAAGQVAAETGALRAAATEWRNAIRLAATTPPDEVRVSCAPECARLLARLFRRYDRLEALGAACDEAAEQMERNGAMDVELKDRLGLDLSLPAQIPERTAGDSVGTGGDQGNVSQDQARSGTGN